MQSVLEHMGSDYGASACGLHVRIGNSAALRLYRDTLGFHIAKTEVRCIEGEDGRGVGNLCIFNGGFARMPLPACLLPCLWSFGRRWRRCGMM